MLHGMILFLVESSTFLFFNYQIEFIFIVFTPFLLFLNPTNTRMGPETNGEL